MNDCANDQACLRIPESLFLAAQQHAQVCYPNECCGVLIGTIDGSCHTVAECRAADNARGPESRHNRYLIPPAFVAQVIHEASQRGLKVLGYYHSHPDQPSQPSEFDREHAWPNTSYLIFSILLGTPSTAQSWRLSDDRTAFLEECIEHS